VAGGERLDLEDVEIENTGGEGGEEAASETEVEGSTAEARSQRNRETEKYRPRKEDLTDDSEDDIVEWTMSSDGKITWVGTAGDGS